MFKMSEFIFGLSGHMVKVSEIACISITTNHEETDETYFGVHVMLKNGHTVPIDMYLPSVNVANELVKEMAHAMRYSDTWLYALHNHRDKETENVIDESEEEVVTEEFVENEEDSDEFTTF